MNSTVTQGVSSFEKHKYYCECNIADLLNIRQCAFPETRVLGHECGKFEPFVGLTFVQHRGHGYVGRPVFGVFLYCGHLITYKL
jgi:hypothetical protein